MIEWPKRYECLDLDEDLDYNTPDRWIQCVSLEDFNKLLEHCVDRLDRSDCYAYLLHSQIKREILTQLKKEAENDR